MKRYSYCAAGTVQEDPTGSLVLYRDIEDDTKRLEWIMPIMMGEETHEANARTIVLASVLLKGMDGRKAIDEAIEQCTL